MDKIVDNRSVAVLGLGEAGSSIAADLLSAGAAVTGWDPVARPEVRGLRMASSSREAVAGASVVLSVNAGAVALAVATEVAPELDPRAVFADLNTAAPALKQEVAAVVEAAGSRFADVALLAPVPSRGLATPALASGSGAEALVAALAPLGMAVSALGRRPGEAAERKLLRSVFAKGMAAAALEALAAARAAGCEEWLRGQLAEYLDGAGPALLLRWEEGSRVHAIRRGEEMEAATAMLGELRTPSRVAAAARGWLGQLDAEEVRGDA